MSKKKTKIVIASVLKPVDDVRNYEKIGCTLQKSGNYEVIMLGSASQLKNTNNDIAKIPWRKFNRLSVGRILIQFTFIKALFKAKPDILIITTHELLFASLLCKIIMKMRLVYDVQEDYYKNLMHQHFYPFLFRIPAACLIRLIEWISRPFVSHYLLAEESYSKDVGFIKNKFTIVDNKSLPIANESSQQSFNIIFTGTLTEYSKTIEAIQLYLKIKNQFDNPKLIVIGHCPSNSYFNSLEELSASDASIILKVRNYPVPHLEIIQEIEKANLAIIGYESNPINEFKIPTKQYEYTAAKLPYLVRKNTYWSQIGTSWGGAIPIDFNNPENENLPETLSQISKAEIKSLNAEWERNEPSLLKAIMTIEN